MTPSEKFVFELTKHSFLSFWSYPNPKGKKDNELCDILIVCDPMVIIISVKEIIPTDSGDIKTDYNRWQKVALEKSFNQIYGAERYLNTIERLKLFDGSIGPNLPKKTERIYYRIAVVIGGEKKMPLFWGDMGKGFIHVFDSISTRILISKLDTIVDFVKYLSSKESFFTLENKSKVHIEGGEEDLLAFYLSNFEKLNTKSTLTVVGAGLWATYKNSNANKIWEKEIIDSYFWDNIIEYLIGIFKSNELETDNNYEEFEVIIRTMAKESRSNRILLSKEFFDFIEKPDIRARPVASYSGVVYVFMSVERNESREKRRFELAGRCLILRRHTQNIHTVIGIATEKNDGVKAFSFDVVYLYKLKLSEDEEKIADEFINKYGWFKNAIKK